MTVAEQIANCGGRRFFLALGAGIVHTGMFVAGLLSEATYLQLQLWTIAAYIAGNTGQKIWASESGSPSARSQPSLRQAGTTAQSSPIATASPPISPP